MDDLPQVSIEPLKTERGCVMTGTGQTMDLVPPLFPAWFLASQSTDQVQKEVVIIRMRHVQASMQQTLSFAP